MKPARRLSIVIAVLAALVAVQAQSAFAAFGITSALGATELPGPPPPPIGPPNLYPGSHEDPLPIIFPEVLGGTVQATVPHPLGMDVDHNGTNVVAQPTVSGNVVNPALIASTIPTGTKFNSYLFHFDPVGAPFFSFYIATIAFDQPIIGVQLFSDGFALQKPALTPYIGSLEEGDLQVWLNGGPGPPPNYYPDGVSFRGIEEDAFVLAIAGNTIMIGGSTSGAEIDQVRIITASPVPEPLTVVSWAIISLIGFGGAIAWRRK